MAIAAWPIKASANMAETISCSNSGSMRCTATSHVTASSQSRSLKSACAVSQAKVEHAFKRRQRQHRRQALAQRRQPESPSAATKRRPGSLCYAGVSTAATAV